MMSKLERLNTRVEKLLVAAVHEVLEVVKETVLEYQEKTARTQRENESLRRRLRELQDKQKRGETVASQLLPPGSEGRLFINQDWVSSHRQVPEVSVTQEKHDQATITRRGSESVSDCDIIAPELPEAPENIITITDTDLPVFRLRSLKSESSLDSEHIVDVSNELSPNQDSVDKSHPVSDDIKREPGTPAYRVSQVPATQSPFREHVNSNTTTGQTAPSNGQHCDDAEMVSYGHIHSSISIPGRRLAFGKNIRSALDFRKHKPYYRKDEEHRCILCGKTFSRVGNLRIHQRCHTGEKPYCCTQCGRCFSQAGDLKKHKRVHTGEKPYCCAQCGKSFSRGENLKRHQKIHVGETVPLHQVWREPQSDEAL